MDQRQQRGVLSRIDGLVEPLAAPLRVRVLVLVWTQLQSQSQSQSSARAS
jgi:hypothetical protein